MSKWIYISLLALTLSLLLVDISIVASIILVGISVIAGSAGKWGYEK